MSPSAGKSSEQLHEEVSLLLSWIEDFQEHPGNLRNSAIPPGRTTLQPPRTHGATQTPKLFPSNEISVWAMLPTTASNLNPSRSPQHCKSSFLLFLSVLEEMEEETVSINILNKLVL